MRSRTTIQILLVTISAVIFFMYIQPTFESMRTTQDETQEYREALENAAAFNQELARLVSQMNSFPTADRRALDRYVPDEVDTIAVMRDIETIVEDSDMTLVGLAEASEQTRPFFVPAQGQGQFEGEVEESGLVASQFTINLLGTYEAFKAFLQDIERNAYPLEVTSVQFSPDDEGGGYSFSLTVETYAFTGVPSTAVQNMDDGMNDDLLDY